MKKDIWFYLLLFLVIIVSFLASQYLKLPDIIRYFLTLPGWSAMFGIVVEAWRDKRAHERNLDILARQQDNSLAIAYHMAAVVFDRQVKFCEEYFQVVHETFFEMFRDGPTVHALNRAQELYKLRIHYSPWLSPEIESGLIPLEKAIREMGADAHLVSTNLPQPDHSIFVKRMYDKFMELTVGTESIQDVTTDEAIQRIIMHLRKVVGVETLTNLRNQALKTAIIRSESTNS